MLIYDNDIVGVQHGIFLYLFCSITVWMQKRNLLPIKKLSKFLLPEKWERLFSGF